jgi:hypothetical protein
VGPELKPLEIFRRSGNLFAEEIMVLAETKAESVSTGRNPL